MATALETRQQAADRQRVAQTGLSFLATSAAINAFPLIDQQQVKRSLPEFIAAVYAIVHRFGGAAAMLAERFMRDTRPRELPTFTAKAADVASFTQTRKSLEWATRGLYDASHDEQAIQALVSGVVQKLVQDPARTTYIDNVAQDRQARGWARDAKPGACAFCAMLATRGVVYKSEASADFQAHDHCHCVAVPVYRDEKYVAPLYVQEWTDLWKVSTSGLSGNAARNAFRRALGNN